jgi:hypothetical protein
MNRTRYCNAIFSLILLSILVLPNMYGQVSQYVIDVKIPPAIEQTPLAINVELTQNTQIQRVVLHYRGFGMSEFKEIEMTMYGNKAVSSIPAKVIAPPYIEYFVSMQLAGNVAATFPQESPEMNPLKIQVKGVDPKDSEVRFLSPDEGEILPAEDLAIAVSLMFASDAVDKNRTRIFLDEFDVTGEALISDDVLLYNPNNFNRTLSFGRHSIKIELVDTAGNTYYSKQTEFNLSTAAEISEEASAVQYIGNGQIELRNEKVDDNSTMYTRGEVRINGTYRYLKFGGDIHLTNEEKSNLQPQNRFLATVQAEEYAKLQIGDAYPVLPSLIVSGKRVRGITGSFKYSFLNLDVTYGQTERAIEGTILGDTTYADSSQASARPKESKLISGFSYWLFSPGTHSRTLFAVRPSFGSGENFQFGITYMKSKDNISSISNGTYPKENLAVGTDLLLAFDDQKVRWATQAAVSVENKDISEGDFSDEDFRQYKLANAETHEDSVIALNEAQDLIDAAKIARKFITVNPNLSPLNPLTGAPSLAYESELSLNYFDNFVRAMVFRRGIAYKSYGNEFIQNDIFGINISDRVRMLENKVMASVSYETKHNNTQNDNNYPTTTYNTLSTSVTAYPGVNLPTFTVGYGFYTRKNPIDLSQYTASNKSLILDSDTDNISKKYPASWDSIKSNNTVIPSEDAVYIANDITDRFFVAINYDFIFLARQTATATMSIANKKDKTFYKRDQNNLNVSASITSVYDIPLQTTLSFIISHNSVYSVLQDTIGAYISTAQKEAFDYQTISFSTRYRLMDDKLNLIAAIAPSFGDFKRLLVQAGADYQVAENHYLIGQFDFINNPGRSSDIILSILYRFMF